MIKRLNRSLLLNMLFKIQRPLMKMYERQGSLYLPCKNVHYKSCTNTSVSSKCKTYYQQRYSHTRIKHTDNSVVTIVKVKYISLPHVDEFLMHKIGYGSPQYKIDKSYCIIDWQCLHFLFGLQ